MLIVLDGVGTLQKGSHQYFLVAVIRRVELAAPNLGKLEIRSYNAILDNPDPKFQ